MDRASDQREPNETYEHRLSAAIERMANRIGGEFVQNERWADVVRRPSQTGEATQT
jgi:hypothetical protein